MTTLLTRTSLVTGPRRVETKIRPRRTAFLVDPNDPQVVLSAITAACLEWGGQHQFIVPCASAGEPTPAWAAIIAKYDPDVVVDLVGADPAYLNTVRNEFGRFVHPWDPRSDEIEIMGASVFSVLRVALGNPPPGERNIAISLRSLSDHPHGLPLAFRFGMFDRRPVHVLHEIDLMRSVLGTKEMRPPGSTVVRRDNFDDILELEQLEAARLTNDQVFHLTVVPPSILRSFPPVYGERCPSIGPYPR